MLIFSRKSILLSGLILCLIWMIVILGSTVHAQTQAPPPTNTPRPTATFTPTPTPIVARLCSDCTRVRLRSTPGTAGQVLLFLDSSMQFFIIGRTADDQWVKVRVSDDQQTVGWLSATYVRMLNLQPIDSALLDTLPVVDVEVDLPPTPTSAFGLPPWLSGFTQHVTQIFVRGQSLGNRANVFSRVGDSITYSPYFLTPIGQGIYQLADYGNLEGVIAFYAQANARIGNSFVNPPLAAAPGWTADKLLNPAYANQAICGGDSPLVCEYKQVKPAVALIMMGTNDSGSGSTGEFETIMRQVLQTTIDRGVIPVLSTIPPKRFNADQSARVDAFNASIRALAQQFDIPLWDYYTTMLKAPNAGISSDGLHPSVPPDGSTGSFTPEDLQYGYTIRNLTALQTLDVLWRLVLT